MHKAVVEIDQILENGMIRSFLDPGDPEEAVFAIAGVIDLDILFLAEIRVGLPQCRGELFFDRFQKLISDFRDPVSIAIADPTL
jgi:hypothetical protein